MTDMNKFLVALTAVASITCGTASAQQTPNNGTYNVTGTSLATMHSAHDVLVQLPGVTYKADEFHVSGRGVPEIYIGKRKVKYINELNQIPASYIQDIKVITEPGAEYGKNVQAVIVIELVNDHAEGFKLDNNLNLVYNSFFAPSDQLTLMFKRSNFQIGGQLGITEVRNKLENQNFTHTYKYEKEHSTLKSFTHETMTPYTHSQTLTGKFFGIYNINVDHSIAASYYVDWQRRNDNDKYEDITTVYGAKNNVIDMTSPISCDTIYSSGKNPTTHHELNVEYHGKVGNVSLAAGNNTVWNRSFNTTNKYRIIHKVIDFDFPTTDHNNKISNDTRSYFTASMPLGKGTIGAGGEFNTRHMDAQLINLTGAPKDNTHGITNEHTYAGYFNATQDVSNWSFAAGLRYEHVGFKYSACPDDQGLIILGRDDFTFQRNYSHLYPSAMAAVKLKDSKLTLSYTRGYNQINMANVKVIIMGSFSIDNYMLLTERINTTSLTWEWKWLTLNATHRLFIDPLCHTTNGNVDFNGNDYHALDFNLSLTPQFGIWHPALTMHAHKQWFDIALSDGRTCLNTPLFETQLLNNFVLPHNWTIRLNGDWRTKGCDRNVRYYKHNFQLNAAIQKTLLNNKLTVELQGNNLLYGSYDDVSVYTDYHQQVNKGHKNRIERNVILSLRYSL